MHYLYVPVQSANPRVLKLMNRACDLDVLMQALREVRNLPGVFLQGCTIVGFPTATGAEYDDIIDFLKAVAFDDVCVHCYSDMPNTESSKLSGKIEKAVMMQRLEQLESAGINHNRQKTWHEWENRSRLLVQVVHARA